MCSRQLTRRLLAVGEVLIAQRKFETTLGIKAGMLQRSFELWRIAAQEIECLGALDGEVRSDLAGPVDVKAHVDAPKLRRIEPDIEAPQAVLRARDDLDRQAGDRDGVVACRIDAQGRHRPAAR